MNYGFSKVTEEWLGGWLSGGKDIIDLPEKVIEETKPYFMLNNEQVNLYKALKPVDTIKEGLFSSPGPSSWTYSLDMDKNFDEGLGIINILASNSMVLIDTTNLGPDYIMTRFSGFPDEQEVIILPGRYRFYTI